MLKKLLLIPLSTLTLSLNANTQIFFEDAENETPATSPANWDTAANCLISNNGSPFGSSNQCISLDDSGGAQISLFKNVPDVAGKASILSFDFYEPNDSNHDEMWFGYADTDLNSTGNCVRISLNDGTVNGNSAYSLDTTYRVYLIVNDTALATRYTVADASGSVRSGDYRVIFEDTGANTSAIVAEGSINASNIAKVGFRTFASPQQCAYIDNVELLRIEEDIVYQTQDWEGLTVPDDDEWWQETPGTTAVLETTDNIVHSGNRALKVTLSNPDNSIVRSEIGHRLPITIGKQYFYRFSVYLPTVGHPAKLPSGGHSIFAQWHGRKDPNESYRNANLAFSITTDSKLAITTAYSAEPVNDGSTTTKVSHKNPDGSNFDLPKGQWITFEVSVLWDYTSNGFLDIWQDGEHIVNYSGPTSYNDADGPYFKCGIYRHISYTQEETIYFDNFQILEDGLIAFPDRDTYTQGGYYSNNNYGSDSLIMVKHQPDQLKYDRQTYIHFDYSQYAAYNTASAILSVHCDFIDFTSPMKAYRVDNSWTESTLTYGNASNLINLGYQGSGSEALGYIDLPIPDATLNDEISLQLQFDDTIGDFCKLDSRESSLIPNRPILFLLLR
ncbi:heparin lyase I family protein [Cerasicoccus maritimus]|uniref:heparin lyase I family protein n=1 Tax=Cerasicoccus maritimus TaxID=490089 RepID=UPI0028529F31|nr:heparin lyase I family protein [Cerasicoccus maritimus]